MRQKITRLEDARPGDLFTGMYVGVRVTHTPLRALDGGRGLYVGGDPKKYNRPVLFSVRDQEGKLEQGVKVESITREVPISIDLPKEPGAVITWTDGVDTYLAWKIFYEGLGEYLWEIAGGDEIFDDEGMTNFIAERIEEDDPKITSLVPQESLAKLIEKASRSNEASLE